MNKLTLLGTAALAASLMAAPAFAQNGNNGGGNNNNGYAFNANGNYNNNANPGPANANGFERQVYGQSGNEFRGRVVGPNDYANIGYGTYAARQNYMFNGNNGNNNNNNNNNNNGNNNWRPSQRNPDLADNGDARMNKVLGTGVFNDHNQQVGSVSDVLIGQNGVFAVIKTNNKKVAVPFSALRFGDAVNNGNDTIVLPNATQARLNTLPVFHNNVTNYQSVAQNGNYQNGNNGGHGWFGGANGNNNNNNNGAGWHGGTFGTNGAGVTHANGNNG